MVSTISIVPTLEETLVEALHGVRDERGRPDFRAMLLHVVDYLDGMMAGRCDPERLVLLVQSDSETRQRLGFLLDGFTRHPLLKTYRYLVDSLSRTTPDGWVYLNPLASERTRRWTSEMPSSEPNRRWKVLGNEEVEDLVDLYLVPSHGNNASYSKTAVQG